jgi:hypothetical protein
VLYPHRVVESRLMRYRITGFSLPWIGAQWERVPGDKETAERVLTFLEDRRVLFNDYHVEDERHCLQSATEIRGFLTEEIGEAHRKELVDSLRAIRAACRKFMDAGGLGAARFRPNHFPLSPEFMLALGDFRTLMGVQIARLAKQYDLDVEEDLARIFPPPDEDEEDLSWVPGFEDA